MKNKGYGLKGLRVSRSFWEELSAVKKETKKPYTKITNEMAAMFKDLNLSQTLKNRINDRKSKRRMDNVFFEWGFK